MTEEQHTQLAAAFTEWSEWAGSKLVERSKEISQFLATDWSHGTVHVLVVAVPTSKDYDGKAVGVISSDSFSDGSNSLSNDPTNLMFIADFISRLALERFQIKRDAETATKH